MIATEKEIHTLSVLLYYSKYYNLLLIPFSPSL